MISKKGLKARRRRSHLVGIGHDCEDGQTRVTKGEGVSIIGGSKETHEKLQEHAIKFGEEAAKRGKTIEQCSHQELHDIVHEVCDE